MGYKGVLFGLFLAAALIPARNLWVAGWEEDRRVEAAFRRGVSDIPYASSRGHLQNGEILGRHTRYDYRLFGAMPGMSPGVQPERDILVVVHGLNNTEVKGVNRFCLARESLRNNGYEGTVVGFSWDGSTNWDPWGATGYREAKHNAFGTAPKLARFVADLRTANPVAKVRLLGYSMGARLVVEAVRAMEEDPELETQSIRIDSVHLVGAAIDDEQLEKGALYGGAIEEHVGTLFNYYSPSDSKLGKYYPPLEGDRAVGRSDLEHPDRAASNYRSRNVASELKPTLDDGSLALQGESGINHSAYLGIRNDQGKWLDDGAMNVVAQDIRIADLIVPQLPLQKPK